jgi:type II/III secretion system protein
VTKYVRTVALVFALALASTAIVRTQEKPAPPPAPQSPRAAATITPIKVQVVISRFQGEKKISSMPYHLSINAMSDAPGPLAHANLRMGAKIPVVMMAMTNVPKDAPQGGPIQYQDVGTNIDCNASTLADGRFRLEITVDDSSLYPDEAVAASATKNSPSFRSFRASDSMILKDGQTAQFTTATDKINSETVKIDVTLTVVR